MIITDTVKTERIDRENTEKYIGEIITGMSFFPGPYGKDKTIGVEIETDKAVYQIYNDGLFLKAERTTYEVFDDEVAV